MFWLSHHHPDEYDRCYAVAGVHVCARCLGTYPVLFFFIAYQLGKIFEREPQAQCYVLTKDKGFDPLLKHLQAASRKCQRIEKISEIK